MLGKSLNRLQHSTFSVLLAALLLLAGSATNLFSQDSETGNQNSENIRKAMTERALNYLLSVQKEGWLGESRQKAVTSLFILACLSSGYLPDHPEYGPAISKAMEVILKNSSSDFLGGSLDPNHDHAVANLALIELIGTVDDPKANSGLYKRSQAAFDYSLKLQDKGVGAQFYGGWRRNAKTKVNDRILTGWFLYALHAGELRSFDLPKSNVSRAVEFLLASQKLSNTEKPDEKGGFSIDAQGLPVRRATATALAVLAIFDKDNEKALKGAIEWLSKHPANWRGPNFFEANFFAVRGLFRTRNLDNGQAYQAYFNNLIKMFKERQEPDGSFPFPPGHSGPTVSMGRAYSTAMTILILNVDRGIIPMDKE